MTARIRSLLGAASIVLLLAGCSPHVPPPSYTDAQLREHYETLVDEVWANTGLEGQIDRPPAFPGVAQRVSADNVGDFVGCTSAIPTLAWGQSEDNGATEFFSTAGGTLSPHDRLAGYECFAAFPVETDFSRVLLTADQRQYLYDYYTRWVVPCLRLRDYEFQYVPTRDEFAKRPGDWNPYYSVIVEDGGTNYFELAKDCGGPYADLDIHTPDWP